jgi:hypothetical protein
MQRRILIGSAVLFAIAALEFGLVGAGAAGLRGGSHAAQPGVVLQTATATPPATATPTPSLATCISFSSPPCDQTPVSPPEQQPPISPPAACDAGGAGDPACTAHSIELSSTPDELFCDGQASVRLDVHLRKVDGSDVADGATVLFSPYYSPSSLSPAIGHTVDGITSTMVRFGPSPFSFTPLVEVHVSAGRLQATFFIPCSLNSPVTPPPCPPGGLSKPGVTSPVSPPCPPQPTSTPTFGPCAPGQEQISPPVCIAPTPGPSIGGEISIGTPSLVDGEIHVPVLTSAPEDAYHGAQIDVTYDTSMLTFSSAAVGDTLSSIGDGAFCVEQKSSGVGGALFACTVLGRDGATAAGTLAVFVFDPKTTSGCATLHLYSYGPPDGGTVEDGTYSIGLGANPVVQQNTYGPDVSVNLADGSVCSGSGGVTGPPATSTPSPVPPQTATPTMTPTSVATATATPSLAVCADLNGDGRVTAVDVLIELLETRKKHAPARYDLNGDGRVDARDVIVVAHQLGRRC